MLELFTQADTWIALASLSALEIVLGIDNLVFIAIVTERLPPSQRAVASRLGLFGALFVRIALLLAISWVMGLQETLFRAYTFEISGRDLILLLGGLFLMGKAAHEIYDKVEAADETHGTKQAGWTSGMIGVVAQIMAMDVIFSLDSVITAVGMVDEVAIMIIAICIAIVVMVVFAKRVGEFVNRHPSLKVLALSFLLLIGVLLIAESLDQHLDKRYVYFAMGFALMVELLNMRLRAKRRTARTGEAL